MRLFISYAHDDKPFCTRLVKLLDVFEVWFDQNLRGGEDWWQRILEKIEWCDGFVYLLSPASVVSTYCQKEASIALKHDKTIIPMIINRSTRVPDYLSHIQFIDLSNGVESVDDVLKLMNTLIVAERQSREKSLMHAIDQLTKRDLHPPEVDSEKRSSVNKEIPYNYVYRLEQRGYSPSTKEVYKRLACDYFERIAGLPKVSVAERTRFLSNLSVDMLRSSITVAQINAWLGMLQQGGHSKISVAKAAVLALVEILADDGILETKLVDKVREIQAFKLDFDKRPRRIISEHELQTLLSKLNRDSKLSVRNATIAYLLMVMRTGEVSSLQWRDLFISGERVSIRSPISGQQVQVPHSAHEYLKLWYQIMVDAEGASELPSTPVIRRFLHGDHIQPEGVSKTALYTVLSDLSLQAGIGRVNPDDLRISFRQISEQKGIKSF